MSVVDDLAPARQADLASNKPSYVYDMLSKVRCQRLLRGALPLGVLPKPGHICRGLPGFLAHYMKTTPCTLSEHHTIKFPLMKVSFLTLGIAPGVPQCSLHTMWKLQLAH